MIEEKERKEEWRREEKNQGKQGNKEEAMGKAEGKEGKEKRARSKRKSGNKRRYNPVDEVWERLARLARPRGVCSFGHVGRRQFSMRARTT